MTMTTEEPKVSMNARFTITQTCAILGIHRNTLLKYTSLGAIRHGVRRSTAQKFYTGSEIIRFWKSQL